MAANETVVVTRHNALVQFLLEQGLIPAGTPVLTHATRADIEGRDVIGVLPLSLARYAASVTEVPLNLPPELRGQELTLEQVRAHAGTVTRYRVTVLE